MLKPSHCSKLFFFLMSLTRVSPNSPFHPCLLQFPFLVLLPLRIVTLLSLTISLITTYFCSPRNNFMLVIHKFSSPTLIAYGTDILCSLRIHVLFWHFSAIFPLGRAIALLLNLGCIFKWHISPLYQSITKKLGLSKLSLPLKQECWRPCVLSGETIWYWSFISWRTWATVHRRISHWSMLGMQYEWLLNIYSLKTLKLGDYFLFLSSFLFLLAYSINGPIVS